MTLSLRIIPKLFGLDDVDLPQRSPGLRSRDRGRRVLATVFYDRIESLGKGGNLSGLLALAMAHELGHLLLGSKAHTDEVIMRPHWTRRDLRQARLDSNFTLGQADAIRETSNRLSQATANNEPVAPLRLGDAKESAAVPWHWNWQHRMNLSDHRIRWHVPKSQVVEARRQPCLSSFYF